MIAIEDFRKLALSLPGSREQPHFEKTSFRCGKKIFATLDSSKGVVCLNLNETDQSVFCSYKKDVFYPVPGAWGKQGWTFMSLKIVASAMCRDALHCAYKMSASKKEIAKLRESDEPGV